jgi:hypothetical protein
MGSCVEHRIKHQQYGAAVVIKQQGVSSSRIIKQEEYHAAGISSSSCIKQKEYRVAEKIEQQKS